MLGALSLEADVVGFDPTIYYQGGRRHVRTVDLSGNEVVYTLVHERPVFYRRTIRGRGTTCWMVQNDDGDIFIVKDGWKALGRVHESAYLKMVEGIDGVGQMRGYQDRLAVLSELRLIDLENMTVEMKDFYHDRELCRVVLEYYGRSLEGFRSRGELLAAYHDALCGMCFSTFFLVCRCYCSSPISQDTRIFMKEAFFTEISVSITYLSENQANLPQTEGLSSILTWLSN